MTRSVRGDPLNPTGLRIAVALLFAMSCASALAGNIVEVPLFVDGFDVADAGPAPTQSCPVNPDANGFFQITSALSTGTVRLPPDYSVASPQPRRLLVALHGCGDTAANFATWAAVPFALRGSQDYIALSVGGREGSCWNLANDGAIVAAAIDHLRTCFFAHQRRIVIAGYDSGGMLAYKLAMTDALRYAGVLIENSGLTQAVGIANVDTVLDAAAWKINVAHTARTLDLTFPIAGVRSDRDKMLARQFPLLYRELVGDHTGVTEDWSQYLIPAMASWVAPLPP